MNPLSIELYKRYKKDITREPLAFAVNNQHMNGGVAEILIFEQALTATWRTLITRYLGNRYGIAVP